MSDRPTPETDALDRELHNPCVLQDRYSEMMEHAQKLERERDEAREAFNLAEDERVDMAKQLTSEKACHAQCQNERDEAREDAAHWKTEYEIVVARLCGKKHPRDNGIISEHEIIPKLTQERDEAREALRKCVWWAECVSRRVTEDRESINWTGLQLARKALADIQMEAAK